MEKTNTANLEDIIQIIVGASALSVPIAFSEESWRLSETLPIQNLFILIFLSLLFINLYSFQSIFQGNVQYRIFTFLTRTILVYLITISVVFIVLIALNRMPIMSEPIVAIKRIIIISFPASMGGVVVDSFDKE